MSRTNINTQTPVGPFPAGGVVAALALDLVFTVADVSNHNEFKFTGKEILLVWNTDASSHNLTLTSVPDEHGRSGDIASYAVAAGVISAFSFRGGSAGWLESDGHVYMQADNALVKFAILTVNN
jgi:hypothetical protein